MAIEFGRTGPRWPAEPRLNEEPVRGVRSSDRPARSFSSRPAASTEGALRVAGEYTRADLANPPRREELLRASVRELVERNPATAGALSTAQKDDVVELMAGDPAMRQRLERYLSKVLK